MQPVAAGFAGVAPINYWCPQPHWTQLREDPVVPSLPLGQEGREGRRKGTSGQLGSGARCRRAANSHHLSTPTQHARVRHKGPAREKRRFAFTSCSDSFLGVSYFGCVPCTVRKKTGKRTNDTLGSKRKGGAASQTAFKCCLHGFVPPAIVHTVTRSGQKWRLRPVK